MAKIKKSTKHILEPHSLAKIQLYTNYLSIYLNILERVSFVHKILLFDLFAGEGIYEDGSEGSPIKAIETINNHYMGNGKKIKKLEILFNDSALSDIESEEYKISRVKSILAAKFIPDNVSVSYSCQDYNQILPELVLKLKSLNNNERALVFLDPWGYKEIFAEDLKKLFSNEKTEIILFLPISHMYRFADRVLADVFPGSEALEKFLKSLFGESLPNTENPTCFIESLKNKFKESLGTKYAETFTLKPDPQNIYCLFFFTHNKTGYERMIEAKWRVDTVRGQGFIENQDAGLFDEVMLSGFDNKLADFILKHDKGRTNQDIREFGFQNGFLPKHSAKILTELKTKGLIEVTSQDGQKVAGLYIDNINRNVHFSRKK